MKFEIAPKETETRLNWYDAKLYCFSLNIDGKTDWRLPTNEELNEIFESENDYEKAWYWSSTEFTEDDPDDDSYAWNQFMGSGNQNYAHHKSNSGNYVRAIRDLKDN